MVPSFFDPLSFSSETPESLLLSLELPLLPESLLLSLELPLLPESLRTARGPWHSEGRGEWHRQRECEWLHADAAGGRRRLIIAYAGAVGGRHHLMIALVAAGRRGRPAATAGEQAR